MKFDIFFSICQTPVDGYLPSEKVMWQNFFAQVRAADELRFATAWVAEAHLSCQVQKQNLRAVIPHFEGEIGLNTDILQLAHKIFNQTKNIEVGSAIRNIQCNGGPLAHAEAVRTFLSLHGLDEGESRKLHLGFAAGRFAFSNEAYGVRPRDEAERQAWPALKGKHFLYATEIFLRGLRGDHFSSQDLTPQRLEGSDMAVPPLWQFERMGLVPSEIRADLLQLYMGSHDPQAAIFANQFLPSGVFQLSITPQEKIEATHRLMQTHYQGHWQRHFMPRTVLVFLDDDSERARKQATNAMANYWRALEGTVSSERISQAVDNALVGSPAQISEQIRQRFDPDDRLMLWFDFHNHDNQHVLKMMNDFACRVRPEFEHAR